MAAAGSRLIMLALTRRMAPVRIGMKRMTGRDPVAYATPPNRAPTVKPTLSAARL